MNQSITELLNARFSCRDFTDQPLAEGVLDAILADAMQSPSWSNTQPYRLAIAQGELRDSLSRELMRRFKLAAKIQRQGTLGQLWAWITGNEGLPKGDYKQALQYPKELQARRLITAKGLFELLEIERGDVEKRDAQTARNFEFFGAPTTMFIFTHKGLGVYSVLDAGILLQSIMLAAQARGVASCAQGALALWRKPLDQYFDIPDDYQLLCGLSLGYASEHKVNRFESVRLDAKELLIEPK